MIYQGFIAYECYMWSSQCVHVIVHDDGVVIDGRSESFMIYSYYIHGDYSWLTMVNRT